MSWTPTQAVITARAIPATLLAYFETHQEDALEWAGGPGLKRFALFANSVIEARRAQKPVFPSISFVNDNDSQSFNGDVITAGYAFTFEINVTGKSPDQTVIDARIYAQAISSMIADCDLQPDTGAVTAVLDRLEIGFDDIRANEKQTEFMQVFQVRGTVGLEAGAYE